MCAYYNNSNYCQPSTSGNSGDASGYHGYYNEPNRMRSMPNVAPQQSGWQEPNLVALTSWLAHQPTPNYRNLSEYFSKSRPYPSDLNDDTFNLKCDEFLSSLKLSPPEIDSLQWRTIGQWNNPDWRSARRKRLTASYFGRVYHVRDTTPRRSLIHEMLFANPRSNIAMDYGRDMEQNAIYDYEDSEQIDVQDCGLFVHPKYGYLGASPDGLVGDDGILEIKCPYSSRDIHPADIPFNKGNFYCTSSGDGNLWLKTNHNFYYQIQGQLEVTGREWCDFVVWTQVGFKVERIWRDRNVWDEMFPALEGFYKLSLLPELVDSRYLRRGGRLPFREPDFVLEARENRM